MLGPVVPEIILQKTQGISLPLATPLVPDQQEIDECLVIEICGQAAERPFPTEFTTAHAIRSESQQGLAQATYKTE